MFIKGGLNICQKLKSLRLTLYLTQQESKLTGLVTYCSPRELALKSTSMYGRQMRLGLAHAFRLILYLAQSYHAWYVWCSESWPCHLLESILLRQFCKASSISLDNF